MTPSTSCWNHLGVFLREHLPRDRNASRHTVQSYADSFQLLVCFAAERLGVRPCRIDVEQLTAPLILDFLDSLERERNNTIGRRNVRLAAFKSFFCYLEFRVSAGYGRDDSGAPTRTPTMKDSVRNLPGSH